MSDWFVKFIMPLPKWARYTLALVVVLVALIALPVVACCKMFDNLYRLTIGNTWTGLAYLTGRKRLGDKESWIDETSRTAYRVRHLEVMLGRRMLFVGLLSASAVASLIGVWLTLSGDKLVGEVPLTIVLLMLSYVLAAGALVTHTTTLEDTRRQARNTSVKLNRPVLF